MGIHAWLSPGGDQGFLHLACQMSAVAASPQKTCRRCQATIGGGESLHGYCLPCLLNPALKFNPTVDPPKFNRFAPYEIVTHADGSSVELGRGSMGITYRAVDTNLQLPVALKVINLKVAGQEINWERFLREARAAASLWHPHVVRVLYYGIAEDGQCYYAMELVEGETLAERVRRSGPLPVKDALEVTAQVASALEAAEKQGLVHRDLKPANLMLLNEPGTNIKMIDFGLAKTMGGQDSADQKDQNEFIGTPAFASPEQFSGGQIDQRSDYFSLGSTLFFLLTGNPPFKADKICNLAGQITQPEPVLAELRAARIPSPVRKLVASLLTATPENRPQNGSALVRAIKRCRRAIAIKRLSLKSAGLAGVAAALASLAILFLFRAGFFSGDGTKSIAVLPFDDLSPAKADSFFTDGIQDDILTNLAKIADLQVISRNSVNGYRGANRLPPEEIGRALHVRYLVDGSIRREGNRIRVTAQLEEAQNGHELWAERYDGDLTDVFAIQAELAEAISQALRAKLSTAEKSSIGEIPTHDLAAYELYLHAKDLVEKYDHQTQSAESVYSAIRLLEEAVHRDSNFALAWTKLAKAHDDLYSWNNADHTESRRAAAETALQTALRLRPDLGEVHLEEAYHLLVTTRDYPTIRRELDTARRTLPNSADLFSLLASVAAHQGEWKEARHDWEQASILDPKNLHLRIGLTTVYDSHRQYDEVRRTLADVASLGDASPYLEFRRAVVDFQEKGDTSGLHALFDQPSGSLRTVGIDTLMKLTCAFADRNFSAAEKILAADPQPAFEADTHQFLCRDFVVGCIKRYEDDDEAAKVAFERARPLQLAYVQQWPNDPNPLMILAWNDAMLGHTEEALREGHQAVALRPISQDAFDGPRLAYDLTQIYLFAGKLDLAITQLEFLQQIPLALDHGDLSLPDWDPLRNDPRFQKILSQLKPIPIVNRSERDPGTGER
jgi:serine/threonine protein kinase